MTNTTNSTNDVLDTFTVPDKYNADQFRVSLNFSTFVSHLDMALSSDPIYRLLGKTYIFWGVVKPLRSGP